MARWDGRDCLLLILQQAEYYSGLACVCSTGASFLCLVLLKGLESGLKDARKASVFSAVDKCVFGDIESSSFFALNCKFELDWKPLGKYADDGIAPPLTLRTAAPKKYRRLDKKSRKIRIKTNQSCKIS